MCHFSFSFKATFVANLFVASISATTALIQEALFGRIFRLLFFATLLSVAVTFIAGINAVLFTTLSSSRPGNTLADKNGRKFNLLFGPQVPYIFCGIGLCAAVISYILGIAFFVRKYDPHMESVFWTLVALSVCCGLSAISHHFLHFIPIPIRPRNMAVGGVE